MNSQVWVSYRPQWWGRLTPPFVSQLFKNSKRPQKIDRTELWDQNTRDLDKESSTMVVTHFTVILFLILMSKFGVEMVNQWQTPLQRSGDSVSKKKSLFPFYYPVWNVPTTLPKALSCLIFGMFRYWIKPGNVEIAGKVSYNNFLSITGW